MISFKLHYHPPELCSKARQRRSSVHFSTGRQKSRAVCSHLWRRRWRKPSGRRSTHWNQVRIPVERGRHLVHNIHPTLTPHLYTYIWSYELRFVFYQSFSLGSHCCVITITLSAALWFICCFAIVYKLL